MSSDQTPAASANESSNLPSGKTRNPIERILVWGLIFALVAVCAREAFARFGYTNSLNSLQAALEADDQGHALMIDQVPTHISGSPSRQMDEQHRRVTYKWSGLLKDYGSIEIQYSDDNEVLGLMTADAPPPPTHAAAPVDESEMDGQHAGSMPGPGNGPGDGSGGGGGRRFDPMQADADGDGKLSLEEAPDRMKESFAEIDTNSDGFVDEEELAARRAARRSEREGRQERPERSVDDANSAADETEAAPAAESSPETPASDKPAEPSANDEGDSTGDEAAPSADEKEQPANEN